jgi:hypothetical protein
MSQKQFMQIMAPNFIIFYCQIPERTEQNSWMSNKHKQKSHGFLSDKAQVLPNYPK